MTFEAIAWRTCRLGDITVNVDYDHRSTPRRFDVAIHVTGDLDADQLARLEKVAATCPVRRSSEAGIEFRERLESRQNDERSTQR